MFCYIKEIFLRNRMSFTLKPEKDNTDFKSLPDKIEDQLKNEQYLKNTIYYTYTMAN